jgi:hypothetical protein
VETQGVAPPEAVTSRDDVAPQATVEPDAESCRRPVVMGRVARLSLVASAAATVAASFGPWLRTGGATRSSYEVVQAAERLEVLASGPQVAISAAWAFLPLLAVLSLLALALGRARLAAGVALVVGLLAVSLAFAVMNAPGSAEWGASAGLGAGLALIVATATTARTARSPR